MTAAKAREITEARRQEEIASAMRHIEAKIQQEALNEGHSISVTPESIHRDEVVRRAVIFRLEEADFRVVRTERDGCIWLIKIIW